MTLDVLLIGPQGYGGEGTYIDTLSHNPPPGVSYDLAHGFHSRASGAACLYTTEVGLNRLLRPVTIPDIGFRALRVERRYDLVHSHAHPVWLSRLRDTPLLMSESSSAAVYLADYLGWSETRLRQAFARSRRAYRLLRIHDRLLNLGRARRLYVYTEWARRLNIQWGVDPAKVEVVVPGIEAPPQFERCERETFTFLFVGSDFERKGGYDVVEAFSRIAGDFPHTHLVIAGSNPDRPNPDHLTHSWASARQRALVRRQLPALQRTGRATHISWIDQSVLKERYFPAADAFVMPTYAEGFGFTNVEAMAFGLPVITSTVGPMREIISPGETGILVSPGDVDGLADAMASLVVSPRFARGLGVAGRRRFETHFALDRFRGDLRQLYARVAAGE